MQCAGALRVYCPHHYGHIAGGKRFEDAGAGFVAHRDAHKQLSATMRGTFLYGNVERVDEYWGRDD